MNFVPVLQLPPLELLPPASLPSELDLVRLFFWEKTLTLQGGQEKSHLS